MSIWAWFLGRVRLNVIQEVKAELESQAKKLGLPKLDFNLVLKARWDWVKKNKPLTFLVVRDG